MNERHGHGHSKTHGCSPTYRCWYHMKQRCLNLNHPKYANYGGRGITICLRWHESFVNFLEDMGIKPDGLSLDRVDNDGPYSPDNCRWATRMQQGSNMQWTKSIDGVKMSISEYCRIHKLNATAIRNRLCRGWELERALNTPIDISMRRCRNGTCS